MANVTVDDTLILPPEVNLRTDLVAGEDIEAGDLIAAPNSSKVVMLATSDDDIYGMALNTAAEDQPLAAALGRGESIVVGTDAVVAGTVYVASVNDAGKWCPYEDLEDDDSLRVIGYATTNDTITFYIQNTGETVPVREGYFIPLPDLV